MIGVENEAAAILPLYSARYSRKAPDFQSENAEIETAFSQVAAACDGRGVWVMDRAGLNEISRPHGTHATVHTPAYPHYACPAYHAR